MPPVETPASLGYRLPAEWEPHEATWIAWPHQKEDWPGKFGPIPWVYAEFVRILSRFEAVRILVRGVSAGEKARDCLARAGADLARVELVAAKTDRAWTRDYLPSFVVRDHAAEPVAAVDWRFNGWAKYENHEKDDRIARKLAKQLGLPRFKPRRSGDEGDRIVLEGGSIDVNGLGTMLTTEECLLDEIQCRNPGLSKADYEQVFADTLGVRHVIWLGKGIVGDDTHGHVDDLARFVAPRTVLTAVCDDPADPNYGPLQDNLDRLRSARDQDGEPLDVIPLPMPGPVVFEGQRLPASYANFYIANGVVLVPTFNDPADPKALATIAAAFPDRKIVGIHAVDLVWGLGTLHCMTHEQPAEPPVGGSVLRAEIPDAE